MAAGGGLKRVYLWRQGQYHEAPDRGCTWRGAVAPMPDGPAPETAGPSAKAQARRRPLGASGRLRSAVGA
ncbi:hypothetical protein TTX_1138 [Thermoproteus tenax Kra 1]|uniref:Uncharacterized protein n=1 Tax=Thermoproteus tenax (strain ATCC 35583 / DSM 2078 / JCM 9277 / NBRC 100435 / Kra 1) TaxID=768679 RepID=G4RJN3_THETK|nr:hypothetical protein TTX_1138 [Thermoproteus tenax Kra 1]